MPKGKGRVWELPRSSRGEGQGAKKWSKKGCKTQRVKSSWMGLGRRGHNSVSDGGRDRVYLGFCPTLVKGRVSGEERHAARGGSGAHP